MCCVCHSMPKAGLFKITTLHRHMDHRFWGVPCSSVVKRQPSATSPSCLVPPTVWSFSLFLCSVWTEEAQCTLMNVSITETFNCSFSCGPDCWKLSQYPCLQVYVNLTSSGEKFLLYHTEETMKINQKVGALLTAPGHLSAQPTGLPSLSTFPFASVSKEAHQEVGPTCSIHRTYSGSVYRNAGFLYKLWTSHSFISW